MVFRVAVRGLFGHKYDIDLGDSEEELKKVTVEELRSKVAHKEGISIEAFRLDFAGKRLDDNCLLWDYGLQHMSTIRVVLLLPGGGLPDQGDGGMGDKDKNQSMEKLAYF